MENVSERVRVEAPSGPAHFAMNEYAELHHDCRNMGMQVDAPSSNRESALPRSISEEGSVAHFLYILHDP